MLNNNHKSNKLCFKVSEISTILKNLLEENFFDIRIQGEISGFKDSTNGYTYFSLKDNHALLNAVCWGNAIQKSSVKIANGMDVICSGKLSIYQSRSNYQLIVSSIEVAGIGALLAMLEKRKKAFAEEGLFNPTNKKELPKFPQIIGVITSLNGVVIQDILHRVSDRFPLEVLIWNVAVQGNGAAEQIADAILGFNKLSDKIPDIIIIARGGGSIEDLWCFNEEEVVRSIASSAIPIISAIGHETDYTLADFVADARAPTPTAAAEMAVPVLLNIKDEVKMSLRRCVKATMLYFETIGIQLLSYSNILEKASMLCKIKEQDISNIKYNIEQKVSNKLMQIKYHLTFLLQLLLKYDQNTILKRGYVIVTKSNNEVLMSKTQVLEENEVCLKMQDGIVFVTVDHEI